jgi:hypothetical protein
MQAYQRKMEKFFVSEEKSFIGSATGEANLPYLCFPIFDVKLECFLLKLEKNELALK